MKHNPLWKLLLPLGACTILSLTGDLTLYAVLPAYGSALHGFNLASIGLILSANRLIRLGSNPLVGLLLAGSPRRGFVLAGFGLGAVTTLMYAFASGTGMFLAGRLLWGICWSLINIGSYTMVLDAAREEERGWASGVLQSMTFVGLALNPFLGGLLSDLFDFRTALLVCSALSGAGFLLALLTLPETHPALHRNETANAPLSLRSAFPLIKRRTLALRALIHPQNAAASYVYFTANFIGDGILLSTLSLYLQNHWGSQVALGAGAAIPIATAGGALLALRAGVAALVSPAAGRLSDPRASDSSGVPVGARRWNGAAWGLLLGASGLAAILAVPGPWSLLGGVTLAASGSAVIVTVAPPLVREINPRQDNGAVLGLLMNAADLGLALAPLATYALLDRVTLESVYGMAALMLLLGLPAIFLARRTQLA